MPEITYKKVAVKSSAKSEDGKKVRVEVDRVTIPVYPTLEMMIDAIGEKDVLELANRQNATDIKNRARQEATREYSEAGYQKLALQKITDTESTEFIELMEGVAAIQNDPSLTPKPRNRPRLPSSSVRLTRSSLPSRIARLSANMMTMRMTKKKPTPRISFNSAGFGSKDSYLNPLHIR